MLLIFFAAAANAAEQSLSRIAFGSCLSQDKPQPTWDAVLAAKPQLFLMLGNNIYADTDNPEIMRAKYAQLAAAPGWQRLRAACPMLATWDDHDYGVEEAGAGNPIREQSRRLFLEFCREPAGSPRWKQPGIYTSRVFGPPGRRVQVILLDTRYNRTKIKRLTNGDMPSQLLGEAQWHWLEAELRKPAEVRLLCSPIQVVAEDYPFEKWANYPQERERLFNLVKSTRAAGLIVLSGHRQFAELSLNAGAVGYPLFDLTSSGLNMANHQWRPLEKNSHRIDAMSTGDNFGMIQIDWDQPDPLLRLQVRDAAGEIAFQQRIPLSLLHPTTAAHPEAIAATKPIPPGVLTPAEAAKKVGEKVTIEFAVKNTGAPRDRSRVFLNSASFRDKDNFTVVLDMKSLQEPLKQAGVIDPLQHFKAKTVRVTGVVSLFHDSPQIVVETVQQIEVVAQ